MPPQQTSSLELALIGNGSVSALVDARAVIVWSCMPRFDSPPVFRSLLEGDQRPLPERAEFAIDLEGLSHTEQTYDPGTAVLRTRLRAGDGAVLEVIDFMPRFVAHGRTFRPVQMIRRLVPLAGKPRVQVRLRPASGWSHEPARTTRGSNHIRFVFPDHAFRLTTDLPITYLLDETRFTLHESAALIWGPDETLDGSAGDTARRFEVATSEYWRGWTSRLALPFEWQDAVIRAAITLKLCQFEETGAIVAAMTTSIPEAPESGRNWDYRYCWIRDAFFVVRALNSLAEVGTMHAYLGWLQDVMRGARDGHIQPLYGIGLEQRLTENIVAELPGYRDMGPVRIGNQAFEHLQHDVYGGIVLAASQSFHDHRLPRRADTDDFRLLELMGDRAWALHDQPDAGIWELRTRARVHTSSALMCWAACDRLAKVARALGAQARARHWRGRASQIRETILARAWSSKRGAFVESFEGETLDASVLLMVEVGFISARDPRFLGTLREIERVLCDGPYVRRYEEADDFGRPTTAFNICAFWRIDALARAGRSGQAREIFEVMLACRNKVGLLSEDLSSADGALWGNFPQTYSMVGVINGAMRLSRPWDQYV